MSRTRRRSLYMAQESAFGTDPSTNGSGYTSVPAEELGDLVDQLQMLETNYATGREWPTRVEPGADGAELQFQLPLWGLTSAAGDGTAASSVNDDVWDYILENVLGVQQTNSGEGVAAGSSTSLTLDSDSMSAGDLALVYDAAATTRAQLAYVSADGGAGSYTVSPAWGSALTSAGVAYGSKMYIPNQPFVGGPTLSCVYVDSDVGIYTLLGGKVTSLSITADVNARLMASVTVMFDSVTEETGVKNSLPTAASAPVVTPMQLRWSPVYALGAYHSASKLTFDFGLSAAPVKSPDAANGRIGHESITIAPVLTIDPLRADSLRTAKRAASSDEMLIQLGGGILASGRVNAWGIYVPVGQIQEHTFSDDDGHARSEIQLRSVDAGASLPLRVARF